ncbi:MAG: tetratricopeptide repeat protein [Planctomycetota bacterium]
MLTTLLICSTLTLAAPLADEDQLSKARAHVEAGENDQAVRMLSAMLSAGEGSDRDVRLLLGDALMAAGRADQAVEILSPVAVDGDHDGLLAMGRSFKAWAEQMTTAGGRNDDIGFAYDEARAYLERAADSAPEGDSRAATALGHIELYVMGDHEAALKRAALLISKNEADGEALLLRGCAGLYASIAAENTGDAEAADEARLASVDDLLAAKEALPDDRVEPWVQLAWLYEVMDRPEAAVGAAAAVVERVPDANFGTLYHLARRYSTERRFGAASRALTVMAKADGEMLAKWIAYDEDRVSAQRELSWSVGELFAQNRFRPAFDVLSAIAMTEPNDADVWNNYALACREVREYEKSAKAYRRALKLDPENPRLMNDTALVLHYYLQTDLGEAAELYEKAHERASEMLEADDLGDEDRALLQEVVRDAKNNLTKLASGDYKWG